MDCKYFTSTVFFFLSIRVSHAAVSQDCPSEGAVDAGMSKVSKGRRGFSRLKRECRKN